VVDFEGDIASDRVNFTPPTFGALVVALLKEMALDGT
jgi:hypothetical protein